MEYKEIIGGKTYNTDTSTLMKSIVIPENLGDGVIRYKKMDLYYGNRIKSWFLYINKTTVDRHNNIFDLIEYIVPVDESFGIGFRKKVEDII